MLADKTWRLFLNGFLWTVVVVAMFAKWQRTLIYFPTKSNDLSSRVVEVNQAVSDIQIPTHDNLKLNGWLIFAGQKRTAEAPDIPALLKQGRPLVIVFSGNGGNRGHRQYLLHHLTAMGADVLIVDHRGYGDNPGSPSEELLARDARRVWDFATIDLKVPAGRIVIYGESLGGGIATRLAGDLCQQRIEPGGLIIQSSFNSLVAAGQHHYPWLPVKLVLVDRFESEQYIAHVTCPILHLHGQHDQVVPLKLGQKLFKAAPEKSSAGIPKQFVLLPRTNHNDVYGPDVTMVTDAVSKFLAGVSTRQK
jgi:fermentation-respiration switch protein FrsA (DUF1100 family)